jgi:hypothetical protein
LNYFDDVCLSASAQVQASNLEATVVQLNNSQRLGNLASSLPILQADNQNNLPRRPPAIGVELAAFVAVQHFNKPNSTIVPDLNERLAGCNIYVTMDFCNTQGNPTVGTKQPVLAWKPPRGQTHCQLLIQQGLWNLVNHR